MTNHSNHPHHLPQLAPNPVERSLVRLQRIAKLMDDQFELPIVHYRIGLDPLIGLIPGGGDWVTWAVSVYILWEAMRLGVPVRLLLRMGLNLSLDLVIGYIPGVGDLADIVIKANKQNVTLLLEYFDASTDSQAPDIIHVPPKALEQQKSPPLLRYGVGLLLIAFLFILASVPLVLIWWYMTRP